MTTSNQDLTELKRKIDLENREIDTKKREKQVKERELDRKKQEMQKVEAEVNAIQSEIDGLERTRQQNVHDFETMQRELEKVIRESKSK